MQVLEISGAEVFGSYLGESEQNLRSIFDKAKKLNEEEKSCLIFLDEVNILQNFTTYYLEF